MPATPPSEPSPGRQLLHLVIGGELRDVSDIEFKDLTALHFVGAFPDYRSAFVAWKGMAQKTVDNAQMRYFIIHAHRLLDPATEADHTH